MARQLEGGHGHLAEMVQVVKNHGAGALHFTAGCKMVEVCEYLLRVSRWTWMPLTKQILSLVYKHTCHSLFCLFSEMDDDERCNRKFRAGLYTLQWEKDARPGFSS
ncbi:hypothetical protein TRIUR3_34000 [Triticum urartu]|uniref:Uncharacterized protein n=1 Tax=Triticum urartu TaxID=4572 RepID=M7YWT4_TRIUA|nr:hypothetical protein TRIUR3_34000 [Triticum urartu]